MALTGIDASSALTPAADRVVDEALQLQWQRWPLLKATFSPTELAHTRTDTRFHVDFLASAMWAGVPALFSDYVCWNWTLFESLGLPVDWVSTSIADILAAIRSVLGDDVADVAAQYVGPGLGQDRNGCPNVTDGHISPHSQYGGLAMQYLSDLIGQRRGAATRLLLGAVEDGVPVTQIYLEVLQPVQRELGRLWQVNRISVAQEHYATAVTQMIMAQLYEYIFTGDKGGRTLVAACVGGELHEIGMRMVADFFEMNGWDTVYIGANTPIADVVASVAVSRADVLALSATMGFHIPLVAEVIAAIRADVRTMHTPVIVGGYPFNLVDDLWQRVGADGSATDAAGALRLAEELVTA